MGLIEPLTGWNRLDIEMAIDALDGNQGTVRLARAVAGLLAEFDEYDEQLENLKIDYESLQDSLVELRDDYGATSKRLLESEDEMEALREQYELVQDILNTVNVQE